MNISKLLIIIFNGFEVFKFGFAGMDATFVLMK